MEREAAGRLLNDILRVMRIGPNSNFNEGAQLLADALRAEREQVLEEACKAVCAECQNGWPVERHESEPRGTWWEHSIGNLSKDCDAKVLRALAAATRASGRQGVGK